MSTNYHTPHSASGEKLTAVNLNSPLGELDAAITSIAGGAVGLDFLQISGSSSQTISAGAVTPTTSLLIVDTEGAAAADDLDTISGGTIGLILYVKCADAARVVTLKHGTGNLINLADEDIVLNDPQLVATFIHDGTNFINTNALVADPTLAVDMIDFNTALVAPAHSEGRLWYDQDNLTLALDLSGGVSRLQIGQENVFLGRNTTGSTLTDMQVVYITGASGNRPLLGLARADAEATSRVVGLVTSDILNNSNGWVAAFGQVRDVDTSAWLAGDLLYLSPSVAGGLTSTKPSAPNWIVEIGTVANAHATQGIIQLGIREYGNLSHLADVDGAAPSNGEALIWNAGAGYYEPGSISGTDVTTKGDIQGFSTVPARIPVGANYESLIADSAETLGVKWGLQGWIPLSPRTVLGSAASSISITGIPGTFSRLRLVVSLRSDAAAASDVIRLTVNGSAVNTDYYSGFQLHFFSAAAAAKGEFLGTVPYLHGSYCSGGSIPSSIFTGMIFEFEDYSSTTRKKSFFGIGTGLFGIATGSISAQLVGGLYNQLTAITSLGLALSTGPNFVAGSSYTLFGME